MEKREHSEDLKYGPRQRWSHWQKWGILEGSELKRVEEPVQPGVGGHLADGRRLRGGQSVPPRLEASGSKQI